MRDKMLTFWTVRRTVQGADGCRTEVRFYKTEREATKAARDKSAERPEKHTVKPSEYPFSFMFED